MTRDKLKGRPTLAAIADLCALALLVAGALALFTSGTRFRIGGVRVSLHTAWRPWGWAAILLLTRYWLVRDTPFAWLLRFCRLLTLVWAPGIFRFLSLRVRTGFGALSRDARQPLPIEEGALFPPAASWRRRVGGFALLFLGFSLLVAAMTWPQIRRLDYVSDLGDPLFSIWRLAWVSHQLPRHPLALFDTNQFYPEQRTLTYSDALLVPALVSAPFFWFGTHPVLIYNVLFLSAFVFSGMTMFLLVRALTGRIEAAVIAGAIFAVYPYRLEHYPHLELQMTMWMPLALWGLHRTLSRGRVRDGVATGMAFALQSLSSLYYGLFLAAYMTVLGCALWLGLGRPRRPIGPLAVGAVLGAALVAPVAMEYMASQPMTGTRGGYTTWFFSAEGRDYLKPHYRSLVYERWSQGGRPERQLFPRLTPVVLSAVALCPPMSVVRIAYILSLAFAVDSSLGLNGPTFTWLRAHVPPFQMIRVPARFSILVGMTLAILAGYGALRLLDRWPRRRVALTGVLLASVVIEAIPNLNDLAHVWKAPPAIYDVLAGKPAAVLAEFPLPKEPLSSSFNTPYLYFSTFHWQNLVNGYSGFLPPSYLELLAREADFPADPALDYLKERGVQFIAVHSQFYSKPLYAEVVTVLDTRHDLEMVAAAPWEGGESRLYRFR